MAAVLTVVVAAIISAVLSAIISAIISTVLPAVIVIPVATVFVVSSLHHSVTHEVLVLDKGLHFDTDCVCLIVRFLPSVEIFIPITSVMATVLTAIVSAVVSTIVSAVLTTVIVVSANFPVV